MDAAFWADRNVFLTGHTGFKGSWLTLWLKRLGAQITGYALDPPTTPSLFQAARAAEGIKDLRGDVQDRASLEDALQATRPEIVFHLAAQPLVRASYAAPIETFAVNVLGTVNLLDAVRRVDSVRAVVVVTSDKCYENKEWAWGYRESEPLGGFDPYSASKACAELATAAWRSSFLSGGQSPVGVATARAGNVIGGGDWALDRIVPDAVRATMAGHALTVRRPNAVRPWQHVLEPLRGYLMLAERLHAEPKQYAGAWNFGPAEDDAVPVCQLLDRFFQHWGAGAWRSESQLAGPHEAGLLRLDCSKARSILGWRPVLELGQTASLTAAWYRQALATDTRSTALAIRPSPAFDSSQADPRQFTLQQIDDYCQLSGHSVSDDDSRIVLSTPIHQQHRKSRHAA